MKKEKILLHLLIYLIFLLVVVTAKVVKALTIDALLTSTPQLGWKEAMQKGPASGGMLKMMAWKKR